MILVFVVGFGGFFVNQARKEIYFLCGNFTKDKPLEAVIKQLNTIKFSRFKIITLSNFNIIRPDLAEMNTQEENPKFKHQYLILLHSPLTFERSNCQIYFQSNTNFDEGFTGVIPIQQTSFQEKLPELVVKSSQYQGLF